jgi:hypothetical protein
VIPDPCQTCRSFDRHTRWCSAVDDEVRNPAPPTCRFYEPNDEAEEPASPTQPAKEPAP